MSQRWDVIAAALSRSRSARETVGHAFPVNCGPSRPLNMVEKCRALKFKLREGRRRAQGTMSATAIRPIGSAVENHGNVLTSQIIVVRRATSWPGRCVGFQLSVNQVDDPVDGDAAMIGPRSRIG